MLMAFKTIWNNLDTLSLCTLPVRDLGILLAAVRRADLPLARDRQSGRPELATSRGNAARKRARGFAIGYAAFSAVVWRISLEKRNLREQQRLQSADRAT